MITAGLALLIALVPLDVAAPPSPPASGGLRLEAELQGLRVKVRLINEGAAPIKVFTGFSCSGPEPFTLRVDGEPRSLVHVTIACHANMPLLRTLAPGERWAAASDTLDGQAHTVVAQYAAREPDAWQGELASPPLRVPPVVTLEVRLSVPKRVAAGAPLPFEVVYTNRSPGSVALRCADELLLVDGKPAELPQAAGCGERSRILAPRGASVTAGALHLPPGRHRLQAGYRGGAESLPVAVEVQ